MSACPGCGAELETPLGCHGCGALLEPGRDLTPYETLGLPLAYALDAADLERRLLRFSRVVHPDYFRTAGPELAQRAERHSAALNAAYEVLCDDARRAEWLVEALGGPAAGEEREMPQAFLMEVLEWNEVLEEVRSGGDGATLEPMDASLRAERARELVAVAAALDPLPKSSADSPADSTDSTLRDVRKRLNAVRYIDRTLKEIEALRLERASSQ